MILLDVVTPACTINLGSGDGALLAVAILIVAVCCVPFMGGGGRRGGGCL